MQKKFANMVENSGKDNFGIFGDSTDYYIVVVVGL